MANSISHSKLARYQMCAKSYEYHYIQKIRPKVTSAALIFGSALDIALNALITNSHDNPEVLFEKSFRYHKINDESVYIPTHTDIVYANADFDSDLLTEDDYTDITKFFKEGSEKHSEYLEAYSILKEAKKQKGFDSFSFDEKQFYNLMNWLSLRRKGLLMLDAYRKKVLPKIEKIHSVQEYISIENEAGDKIVGYVDLVADIKNIGTVILDNKTSASEYEEDSVITSPQLSLYTHILEEKYKTRKAGYIVLRKGVIKNRKKKCKSCGYDGSGGRHKTCNNEVNGKRCGGEWEETISPEIHVQFIVDEIPKQTEAIVLENADSINESIKQGNFHRNLNSCTNWYGGLCPFINLCYKGDMHGLLDMNKERKKKLDNEGEV